MSFGGFLRATRTMNGLSQSSLAKMLNLSRSGICDIEKGRQFVSIELAAKIAKKCRISEALAIECAIRDSLRRAGLKLEVSVKTAA